MEWRGYLTKNFVLQAFIITFLLFGLSYLTVGWWTDAYQHMFDTVISGELTGQYLPAAYNPFPEYMSGAAFILNRLELLAPFHWVAFFLNGVLFVSIWILFSKVLKHSVTFPTFSRIILISFFALLFFESVVLYHMVRITMFAGIAAASFLVENNENRLLSKKAIPYLLLFIIALWIRSNVHLFILTFITAVLIVHKKPLKPLIPFWTAFVIFFIIYCKIVFWTDYSKDLNSFFLYNTEFKLYYVGKYQPDLNLTQPLDSIKYMAVKNDILGDEQNLGIDFYERINIFSNIHKFSLSQAYYAWQVFVSAIAQNIYFIIADVILIFFYIFLGGDYLHHYKRKTIGLFVFFYLVVFAICFIKMENRFLVPFQILFLFTIIILHRPKLFSEKKNSYYLLVFALLLFPVSATYIFKKIDYCKSRTFAFKDSLEWLKQNHSEDIIVFNTGFVTQNRPYETFYQMKFFKKFYMYNYYACQLSQWYRPYLEKECNCNVGTLHPFYDYLAGTNAKVILADKPARINVLKQYLLQVYKKDYEFNEVAQGNPGDSAAFRLNGFGQKLDLFELKKAD